MAMEKSTLKKSYSSAALSSSHYQAFSRRSRSTTGVYALVKSSSTSDLPSTYNYDGSWVRERYRPTHYRKYHRDYDLYDDYWWDRRFNTSSLFWPHHCWPNRRYSYRDPYSSLWWYYPSLSWYPHGARQTYLDSLDPVSWRQTMNPSYDKPLCYHYKPWTMEISDSKRTVQMYKQGLIDFESVEKKWLVPSFYQRKFDEYSYPYKPSTWYTSPRRYHFTFDTM